MKQRTLVYLGLGLVAAFGFATARSKQKCKARLRAIRKAYPGLTDAQRKKIVEQTDGGSWPDCSGIPIFREGI